MKKSFITSVLALLLAGGSAIMAGEWPKEYIGLPGDNLNLYAVMNLFQESETLEGFERNLNDEKNRINNLDLNGDNQVDYITVSDYVDGDVHNIVLRVALNRSETQDVAVFTVQKLRDGSVQIQLVGDEDLYGRNYIIEPIYAETPNPGYTGTRASGTAVRVVTSTYYDIAAWPVVTYIYRPDYVIWRSSWFWGYWPAWWYGYTPWYWHCYYGYHYNWFPHYYAYYHHWNHHRYLRYNDFYHKNIRQHSHYVASRIEEGHYRTTYSRPETRKEGEAYYAQTNSGQNSRTRSGSVADNTNRRSSSTQTASRQATESRDAGTIRRSGSEVNSNTRTNEGSGVNSGTTGRRTSTTTATRTSDPAQVQNREVSRRGSSEVTGRTTTETPAWSHSSPTISHRESTPVSSANTSSRTTVQRSGSSGNQPATYSGSQSQVRRRSSSTTSYNTGTVTQRTAGLSQSGTRQASRR
ncbi:MAG: hypothetical protein GYA41_03895 [Bacteroidales bacterium]|nr:hypothetical protein [Bacteroidales bacterium]